MKWEPDSLRLTHLSILKHQRQKEGYRRTTIWRLLHGRHRPKGCLSTTSEVLSTWRCMPYCCFYWHLHSNVERWVLWEEAHSMTGLLRCYIMKLLRSRVSSSDLGVTGNACASQAFYFHFYSPAYSLQRKRRGPVMPEAELYSLMARNQTCHMRSNLITVLVTELRQLRNQFSFQVLILLLGLRFLSPCSFYFGKSPKHTFSHIWVIETWKKLQCFGHIKF